MEASKKRLVWQFCLFLVVFVVAFSGTKFLIPKIVPNYELEKVSAGLNKKGAVMVDKETRLDNSSVSGDTLVYNYTLVNVDSKAAGFSAQGAEQFIQQNAQQNLDNSPNMDYFRKKKVFLKYIYKDKNSKPLFNFTINAK